LPLMQAQHLFKIINCLKTSMNNNSRLEAVEHFYDFHPISAQQIFEAVAARGIAKEDITEEVLQLHDQDHYGGTQAVDRLMAQASLISSDHLLDVCSGVGGPARYISWKSGCQVTGLDLTASRVAGAIELTQATGLAERVDFVQGNALEMPFDDNSFTCVIGQEAFAHIPNKKQLISECARVLKPGGRMVFSDIMSHQKLSQDNADRLFEGMRFSEIATLQEYTSWLATEGLTMVQKTDLSSEWTRILVDRHAMYRSLETQTVSRLGREHFDRYDRAYEHFVGLYKSGVLSGALVHADKG
jgi:sarcosine/dimethylglycine N-methyltransferase